MLKKFSIQTFGKNDIAWWNFASKAPKTSMCKVENCERLNRSCVRLFSCRSKVALSQKWNMKICQFGSASQGTVPQHQPERWCDRVCQDPWGDQGCFLDLPDECWPDLPWLQKHMWLDSLIFSTSWKEFFTKIRTKCLCLRRNVNLGISHCWESGHSKKSFHFNLRSKLQSVQRFGTFFGRKGEPLDVHCSDKIHIKGFVSVWEKCFFLSIFQMINVMLHEEKSLFLNPPVQKN